jgi:ribonucleoside-triphosphate reductase (thioredoxin)
MRNYKNGQWWVDEKQRALANISAAYTEKPDIGIFMKEWQALYESKSGERGIFNRVSARKQAEACGRRDTNHDFGTNPCGEIILRPFGYC